MSAGSQCRGDERRATVDERHCGERRRAVLERHGARRYEGVSDRCTYRCGQRHRLPEHRRVRRRCEGGRRGWPHVDLSNHVHELIGLDDVDARAADIGAGHAEEVIVRGAADDGVGDEAVADEPAVSGGGPPPVPRENGPAFVVGRTLAKIQGGGTAPGVGMQPWSTVKLIEPAARTPRRMIGCRTGP